jgi:hypothetical protein
MRVKSEDEWIYGSDSVGFGLRLLTLISLFRVSRFLLVVVLLKRYRR